MNKAIAAVLIILLNEYLSVAQQINFCDTYNTSITCQDSPYRSYNGMCNNLRNPYNGAFNTPYVRLMRANYADGISTVRRASDGSELPNARQISLSFFEDNNQAHPRFAIAAMQFGQFVTHDMASDSIGLRRNGCCLTRFFVPNPDPSCFAILIPPNDIRHVGETCLDFVRTLTDRDVTCPFNSPPANGQAQQLNSVTAYLDLSVIYGNTREQLQQFRSFQNGRLTMETRNNAEWPPQTPIRQICSIDAPTDVCYLGGDNRMNQSPHLTAIHIMFVREHNRIAGELRRLNPNWNDEKLFQEARKVTIGIYQNIVYYEWLPLLLGEKDMKKAEVIYDGDGFVNDYDENVNAMLLNEFITAAFRVFHTLIEGHLQMQTEARQVINSTRLGDALRRPKFVTNNFDDFTRGMTSQPAHAFDESFDDEAQNHLFKFELPFGTDLPARDIQRGRDHGLPTYNEMRIFCGFKEAKKWEHYLDTIPKKNLEKLQSIYKSYEDVDLYVGATFERDPNSKIEHGKTFQCILLKQFKNLRQGDRYWFENSVKGFTLPQLKEIRRSSLARIICDNSNNIQNMQERAFLLPNSNENALKSCQNIQRINLDLWKEV